MKTSLYRALGFGLVAGVISALGQQPAQALGGSLVVSQAVVGSDTVTTFTVSGAEVTSTGSQLPLPIGSSFDYTLKLQDGVTPGPVTTTWNAGTNGDPFYQFGGGGSLGGSGIYRSLTGTIFGGTLDTTYPDDTNTSRLFVYKSGRIEIQVSSALNNGPPECYTGVTVTGAVNTTGCAGYLNNLVLNLETSKAGYVPDSAPGAMPTISNLLANYVGTYSATGLMSTGAGEGLTNYKVQQQAVPGPLPVLGAAAAFSYSRRLRRRQQLSRTDNKPAG
jgi:hypothetical protein